MSIALSRDVSSIENARRLADHNSQVTQTQLDLQKNLDQALGNRNKYLVLAVGVVALGVLAACTTSLLIGGAIICSAAIPVSFEAKHVSELTRISRQLTEEKDNIQFIFNGIEQLFREALSKKKSDLITKWNNGQVTELSKSETSVDETADRLFRDMVQAYNESECFIQSFNGKEEIVSYKNLKHYALAISSMSLRQQELIKKCDSFKLTPNLPFKKSPLPDVEDVTGGQPTTSKARQFIYFVGNEKQAKTFLLEDKPYNVGSGQRSFLSF